nr:MAG TPA: hypothetical protein [Caudoviricetes sp.]
MFTVKKPAIERVFLCLTLFKCTFAVPLLINK